jgi:hypothetical protein
MKKISSLSRFKLKESQNMNEEALFMNVLLIDNDKVERGSIKKLLIQENITGKITS